MQIISIVIFEQLSVNPRKIDLPFEEVISMDIVASEDKIHLLVAGNTKQKSSLSKVIYLNTSTLGKDWSEFNEINNNVSPISRRGNDVQLAVFENNIVASWQVKGDLPGMGPLISYYSKDAGITWFKGANPAGDDLGDQSHTDIVADKIGQFHLIWLADPEENGYQSLRYSRSLDGGINWQASNKLDDSTCSCCWNSLTLSPSGSIDILYRDMKPKDMAFIHSGDQGVTWSNKSIVGNFGWEFDGCPHVGGAIAVSDSGVIYSTVWTGQADQAGLYCLKSIDEGETWSTPVLLSKTANHSDIAVNRQKVVAVWEQHESDGNAVYFNSSIDEGITWSKATRLSSVSTIAIYPRILAHKNGFFIIWTEKKTGKLAQLMGMALHKYKIDKF